MSLERTESRPVTSLAGKLIVFEGADGAGKTTLVQAIIDSLRTMGIKAERFSFPGAELGTVGRLVYDIHHQPASFGVDAIAPVSLQALHVAAHVDAIQTRIVPALRSGACVLLDRFWWSTWVYGVVAGVPARILRRLIDFERTVWGATRPEVTRIATDRSIEVTKDAVIGTLLSRSPRSARPHPRT